MSPYRALGQVLGPRLRGAVDALSWVLSRPLAALWWLRLLRVELWNVEGEEQSSRLPLSILRVMAYKEEENYLLRLIFGETYRQRLIGRCWIWNVAKAIPMAGSAYSMIVGKIGVSHLKLARWDDWFLIPSWVLGEVALPYDAGVTGKFSSDLRRQLRRHAFQFEVARDPQQFEEFYHNMYIPNVTQTYGDCADLYSYESLKAVYQAGDLLLVKNRQQVIAGGLIRYSKAGPYLWEMGIRDGNRDYVKDGAGRALYHFNMQYLHERGYKKAFLGWSRAFLRDGVLRHKRTWSQRIVGSYPNHRFALRILSHTPAARAFLCNNPFIFNRDDVLYAAVFVDVDKPLCSEEIQQIDKDYFHPGLSRLFIYCLPEEHAPLPVRVPAELSEHIELRCAADVLTPLSASER